MQGILQGFRVVGSGSKLGREYPGRVKAKRTLDQLSILTKQQIDVLRDNQLSKINVDEIVQDDLIILNTGMQIPVDCELLEGHIEANESLLTGESDAILKVNGDSLLSGSFVTS